MNRKIDFFIPSEAELIEIAKLAAARHLHLITDGKHSKLSPVIPQGWKLHGMGIKQNQVPA